jgi:GNAT superfamily N-acetyltransferase
VPFLSKEYRQKYAPGQARDQNGQFASGGGSFAGTSPKAKEVQARIGATQGYVLRGQARWTADYTDPQGETAKLFMEKGDSYIIVEANPHGGWDRRAPGMYPSSGDGAFIAKKHGDAYVVDWIMVEDDMKRRGIGTAMLEFARREADAPVIHSGTLSPEGKPFSEVVKYAPGQARDSHGRFANGIGGSDFGHARPIEDLFGAPRAEVKQTLQQVYEGRTYGDGFTVKIEEAESYTNSVLYIGGVFDAEGNRAGGFNRELRREWRETVGNPEGGPVIEVHHELLQLDREHQKMGFATDFLKRSEDWYNANGVASIKLDTAWDGGYVWAKAGYEWDMEQMVAKEATINGFMDHVGNVEYAASTRWGDQKTADLMRTLTDSYTGDAPEVFLKKWSPSRIANLTTSAGSPIGRDLLVNTQWNGVKHLDAYYENGLEPITKAADLSGREYQKLFDQFVRERGLASIDDATWSTEDHAAWARVYLGHEVAKYAPGQARDSYGRWSGMGTPATPRVTEGGWTLSDYEAQTSRKTTQFDDGVMIFWEPGDGPKYRKRYPDGAKINPLDFRTGMLVDLGAGGAHEVRQIDHELKDGKPVLHLYGTIGEDYGTFPVDGKITVRHEKRPAKVEKYAPGQARDSHGRFASGVGGSGISGSNPADMERALFPNAASGEDGHGAADRAIVARMTEEEKAGAAEVIGWKASVVEWMRSEGEQTLATMPKGARAYVVTDPYMGTPQVRVLQEDFDVADRSPFYHRVNDPSEYNKVWKEALAQQAGMRIGTDWNSNSQTVYSYYLQNAVERDLLKPGPHILPGAAVGAAPLMDRLPSPAALKFVDGYARATYAHTQDELKARGITQPFTLYRGMGLPPSQPAGMIDIPDRPLSSYTLAEATAKSFAKRQGDYVGRTGYINTITVDPKDVWSLGGSGTGAFSDKEVIVLAHPNDGSHLKRVF